MRESAQVPERHARPGSVAGIDLGVKTLLTGADDQGRVIEIAGARLVSASGACKNAVTSIVP